jgi:hypothetical protein
MQPPPARRATGERLLLAALALMFCFACIYLACFTAEYATGDNLPPRSQNEVIILFVSGLTIGGALLGRSLRGWMAAVSVGSRLKLAGEAIVAVLLAAVLISPLSNSATMNVLRAEQNSFHTFWLESMARHARLTLAKEDSLVLANRSVFPTTLTAYEPGDKPDRLPNDCIAQFYGKKSVIVKPPVRDATPSEVLALLPGLIGDIRSHDESLKAGLLTPLDMTLSNIEAPSLLVTGQNFSSPWGSVVMTRSKDATTLDFHSVSPAICRELLLGGGQIDGVVRVAGSSKAVDERLAPVSAEAAERACSSDTAVNEATARLIFRNENAQSKH